MKNNLMNAVGNSRAMNLWIPSMEEETHGGIREIQLRTRHFTNRKLFLTGEITDETAVNFVSEMLYLQEKDEPVDIYINSPGGSVSAGLVICDVLDSCADKMEINLYCIGMAASMGALILACGQKGRRFILPHSKVMIHEPLIAEGMGGSATSIQKTAEYILETKAVTNGILAAHTGKTIEEINKATSYDHIMNAEEAVEFGICDEIRNIF